MKKILLILIFITSICYSQFTAFKMEYGIIQDSKYTLMKEYQTNLQIDINDVKVQIYAEKYQEYNMYSFLESETNDQFYSTTWFMIDQDADKGLITLCKDKIFGYTQVFIEYNNMFFHYYCN